MSISIVGSPQTFASGFSVSAVSVNSSTGVTIGDVIFAYVGTTAAANVTVTTPTGWTLINGPLNPITGVLDYLFQRISDGTDGSSYTFNFSGTVGSGHAYVTQITYRGVNNTTPVDGSITTASQASGTSLVLPAVSSTGTADMLVAFIQTGASGTPVISGMTQELATSRNYIFDQQLALSGTTGTKTVTGLGSTGYADGFLFAVFPVTIILVNPIIVWFTT
jgi:hypothetical protein